MGKERNLLLEASVNDFIKYVFFDERFCCEIIFSDKIMLIELVHRDFWGSNACFVQLRILA